MRCPDCDSRNSVAARACESCGHKFKPRPVPGKAKIAAGVVVAGLIVWSAASFIIPNVTDPEQNLARIAKDVANGPKNSDDNKRMADEFDQAIRRYLSKLDEKSSPEIIKDLGKILPPTAYEVHVVDLPRGLKIVEIDTVLQACDYLLMNGGSGHKVFPLPGLEVFDDARLINESAGPMLVTIGHSGGQPPHRPEVKVYAVLPDNISDETDKLLSSPVRGEGAARFAKNNRDVILDISLLSLGQAEKLFVPGPQNDDGIVHQYLDWKDAHYSSRFEYGPSPFTALYAVARCMRYPDLITTHRRFLGAKGEQLVHENKSQEAGDFRVKRLGDAGDKVSYILSSNVGTFLIDVDKANGACTIVSARNAPSTIASQKKTATPQQVAISQPPAEAPAPTTAPAAIVEKKNDAAQQKGHEKQAKAEQERLAKEQHDKELEANAQKKGGKGDKTETAKESHQTIASATPSAVPGESAQISKQLTANTVNLRSTPSTDGKTLTSLTRGVPVQIIGKDNGWYKVRSQGKEGYIYAGLIDYKKPDAYTTATIRKNLPVTDGHKKQLGHPQVGDRLVVLGGLENNKYKVQLSNGKTGYVDKDAIDVTIDEPQFVP